jgi:hypothetical protein
MSLLQTLRELGINVLAFYLALLLLRGSTWVHWRLTGKRSGLPPPWWLR